MRIYTGKRFDLEINTGDIPETVINAGRYAGVLGEAARELCSVLGADESSRLSRAASFCIQAGTISAIVSDAVDRSVDRS